MTLSYGPDPTSPHRLYRAILDADGLVTDPEDEVAITEALEANGVHVVGFTYDTVEGTTEGIMYTVEPLRPKDVDLIADILSPDIVAIKVETAGPSHDVRHVNLDDVLDDEDEEDD